MLIAALMLSACAPLSRYNIEVRGDGARNEQDQDQFDVLVNYLAISFEDHGIAKASTFKQLVASHFYVVRVVDSPIPCSGKDAVPACLHANKRSSADLLTDNSIELLRFSCWGDAALNHVLVHGYAMDVLPPIIGAGGALVADGDPDHVEHPDWWAAQREADRLYKEAFCP